MVNNNGKPYQSMDDLGGTPTIFGNIHIIYKISPPLRKGTSSSKHAFQLGIS